jgi:hypothetical protein
MAQGACEDPPVLSRLVLEMVPYLLSAINSSLLEQADHALLFLYFTIDYISKMTVDEIIGLGGFKYLASILEDTRTEPRHLAATVCDRLYKNNLIAQRKFLQVGGGAQLVQLLMWESEDENLVTEALMFLQDLVTLTTDEQVKVVSENVEVLLQSKVHEVLNCLPFDRMLPETCEEIDKLVRILAE